MIVDAHTHIFPPDIAGDRESYLASDSTFAELYASPQAKLATASDLLASMDTAGVDVSLALGFAWADSETCAHHNDYLIEAAAVAEGRIIPFCNLPLGAGFEAIEREARRCVDAGVPGFGELRPDNLGFDLNGPDGELLAALAIELDVTLLFHVAEPVGHSYPGKLGLGLGSFYAFVQEHPSLKVIGAHWAGGLPFFAAMPEVKQALANTWVDTAASSLLYGPEVYSQVVGLIGAERILFGSDFPLLSQARSKARMEVALDADAAALVLGGNAQGLLGLQ